jgi:single-stranded-DNA-specific exonuclease
MENFDIVLALTHSKDLLLKFGGHKQAAGFTLESSKVDQFYQKLLQYADTINLEIGDPVLYLDAELTSPELNFDTLEYVEKLSPFGFGNPKPRFLTRNIELIDASTVGAQSQHAKMRVRIGSSVFSAIAFNQAYLLSRLKLGQIFSAAYELTSNEWNGLKQMDLKIIDIKTE